jgi:hypothetical protein
MQARSIVFLSALLASTGANPSAAQDSMSCEAKQLCSKTSSCAGGTSLVSDPRPGEIQGLMSWHSDVFRKDTPGPIARQSYCYYRVIKVDDATVLPLFWRAAGLRYLGTKAGDEKGCVFACTDNRWDEKAPPSKPISGTIQYQTKVQSKDAESWGPESGWTANDLGQLERRPGATDPDSGSRTLVAQETRGVAVEFETRVLPNGMVRYGVRNVGKIPVRVVWNVARNDELAKVEGPFTRSGIELGPGESRTYDIPVVQAGKDATITRWQTQASVSVANGPSILAAIPAVGPSNGVFASNPVEFWQAGAPR